MGKKDHFIFNFERENRENYNRFLDFNLKYSKIISVKGKERNYINIV